MWKPPGSRKANSYRGDPVQTPQLPQRLLPGRSFPLHYSLMHSLFLYLIYQMNSSQTDPDFGSCFVCHAHTCFCTGQCSCCHHSHQAERAVKLKPCSLQTLAANGKISVNTAFVSTFSFNLWLFSLKLFMYNICNYPY